MNLKASMLREEVEIRNALQQIDEEIIGLERKKEQLLHRHRSLRKGLENNYDVYDTPKLETL